MSDEGETSPIRVYCRFRDDQHLYASDISQSQKDHIEQFSTSFNVETHQVSIYPSQVTRKAIQFEFTGLIPPHMTQEQTFQMIAKDNIALVLNGYNCSIIAYVHLNIHQKNIKIFVYKNIVMDKPAQVKPI